MYNQWYYLLLRFLYLVLRCLRRDGALFRYINIIRQNRRCVTDRSLSSPRTVWYRYHYETTVSYYNIIIIFIQRLFFRGHFASG